MTVPSIQPFWLFVHLAGVIVWIGGMFFAYICLRPVAVAVLEPPQRLSLWLCVFTKFFTWVWIAIIAIFASGFAMFFGLQSASIPWSIHLMMADGLVMLLVFLFIYFGIFPGMRQKVLDGEWAKAGAALNSIRKLVAFNLVLGGVTVALATLGRLVA